MIAIEDFPKELRLYIRLIEIGKSHQGKNKIYDNVAGCLLASACDLAFEKDYGGFVSLTPKTLLVSLYKEKYGFRDIGLMLYTELTNSEQLIKKYLKDEEI